MSRNKKIAIAVVSVFVILGLSIKGGVSIYRYLDQSFAAIASGSNRINVRLVAKPDTKAQTRRFKIIDSEETITLVAEPIFSLKHVARTEMETVAMDENKTIFVVFAIPNNEVKPVLERHLESDVSLCVGDESDGKTKLGDIYQGGRLLIASFDSEEEAISGKAFLDARVSE
jgi:hypothetical protein